MEDRVELKTELPNVEAFEQATANHPTTSLLPLPRSSLPRSSLSLARTQGPAVGLLAVGQVVAELGAGVQRGANIGARMGLASV